MHRYTHRSWWSVEDAARVLRVNRKTLYDACRDDDFPHMRVGPYIKIPCEALLMRLHPSVKERTYNMPEDVYQLELPIDAKYLVPVRVFRNTREVITAWHYERERYRVS